MTQQLPSLHSVCKEHGLPKSSVHSYLTKERNFDLSEGVSDDAISAIWERFTPKSEKVNSAIVHKPTVETLPANGHGKVFDFGGAKEIHLHIHTGNGVHFQQQASASDATTQNIIAAVLDQATRQGVEDRVEADQIGAAIKAKYIETQAAGFALGKPDPESSTNQEPPDGGDGSNDFFGDEE